MTGFEVPFLIAQGTQAAPANSPLFGPVFMVLMIAMFYFIAIRPQQRREKERQAMIAAVKKGDRVVFCGGLLGTVAQADERDLTIKIADNTKVEILRGAVNSVLKQGESPALPDEK